MCVCCAGVEVAERESKIHWLGWKGKISRIKSLGHLLYSPRDVGPAGLSQLVARPDYFRKLPRGMQEWTDRRAIRPAGAAWLQHRVTGIKVRTGVRFESAVLVGGQRAVTSIGEG